MPILVMKFGGTSVANLDRIARVAKRVGVEVARGFDVIVIVSAMSGKTMLPRGGKKWRRGLPRPFGKTPAQLVFRVGVNGSGTTGTPSSISALASSSLASP